VASHKEADCPEKGEEGKKKCVNCNRDHPAWDRQCSVAVKEIRRAKEAYTYRPLQFDITQGTQFKLLEAIEEAAEPQRLSRERPRGRLIAWLPF